MARTPLTCDIPACSKPWRTGVVTAKLLKMLSRIPVGSFSRLQSKLYRRVGELNGSTFSKPKLSHSYFCSTFGPTLRLEIQMKWEFGVLEVKLHPLKEQTSVRAAIAELVELVSKTIPSATVNAWFKIAPREARESAADSSSRLTSTSTVAKVQRYHGICTPY
eukprot:m.341586 g.341586  ORF g.341586 m.341586 type:complete len:163 (-) comp16113_c0_seq13:1821-2309(-)